MSGRRDALPGRPIWPDLPWLRVYGRWRPEQLRTAEFRGHRLLVLGHCLAGAHRMEEQLRAVVDGGSLDGLAEWPGAYIVLLARGTTAPTAPTASIASTASTASTAPAIGRELLVRTDLACQFPVYVSAAPGETLVGTHPDVIAGLHRRAPDPVTAAARIACSHVLPMWEHRSAYAGVRRLPGAAFVRLRPDGIEAAPPARPTPGPVSLAEGGAALRGLLGEAVGLRCQAGDESGPGTGVDLSGGLDSSTVALLGARFSASPVLAVTYHHPRAPAGDLDDALYFAGLDQRLRHVVVHGTADTLPYQDMLGAPRDPEPAAGAIAWRRSLLRLERAKGTRRYLTGEGGDAVLSAAPAYLADLARPRTARAFVRHCLLRGRRHDFSALRLGARAARVAATGARPALIRLSRGLPRSGGHTLDWSDGVAWWPVSGEAVGWLTPSTRRTLAELAADPATAATIPAGRTAAEQATLTELRHSGDAQRHLRELGHRIGVDVHAPYLDDLVVRACLRVRPAARMDPEASKPLLAAALRGVLPDALFVRGTKGDYTREEYLGARRAAAALRRLVIDSRLADLGVLEPAAVLRSIDRLIAGCAVALGPLRQALATEVWLRGGERS
ncbi:MAG TPA: asparagine synthase-related protein [Streptosporangiaceae bacterium]|nr:asparagine synthase-related protein [Streptosporangiaceae bacterium]